MHIKFLNHGQGSGRAAARYLLGTHDHNGIERAEVRVLRGDPTLVGEVADSLEFQHRYTSGVVAFHKDDAPTIQQINEVLDGFERVAFAGLDADRYAFAAVLHRDDDGSVHVHVFCARVDLATGKSLNIAPPGWERSYDPLRDFYNHWHGWARPDDPARARILQPGHAALIDADALRRGMAVEPDTKALITEYLTQRIAASQIKDRADILAALEDAGLVINRQGADYISVKDPETNEKYRLKGGIYVRSFTAGGAIESANSARPGSDRRRDERRAESARSELEAAIERRAQYNAHRYQIRVRHAHSVDQESALTDGRAHKPTSSPVDDVDAVADRGDDRTVRTDDRPDLDLPADAAFQRDDRDLDDADAARAGAGDRDHQSGVDGLHRQERPAAAVQISITGETKSDGNRSAVDRIIESVRRRIGEAGASLDAAIDRCRVATSGIAAASRDAESAGRQLVAGAGRMIENRADELEVFKTGISLTEYAQACGYSIDTKKSSKHAHVLRDGSGDKIVISRDTDGHDVYFSVRDDNDSGSIIDFVMRRQGLNLGQARRELRPWAGLKGPRVESVKRRKPAPERIERPAPVARDRAAVIAAYHMLGEYDRDYLSAERKISQRTIDAFKSAVRSDKYGNACFIHRMPDGEVAGWEKKNRGFTGYSDGGEKALFMHTPGGGEIRRIVVVESGIDAMSYYELHGQPGDCYVSIAGSMSPEQRAALERVVASAPAVVVATDSDESGQAYAEAVRQWRSDATRETPEAGKDWNDALKAYKSAERSRSMTR